jgi:transcriptional regulator with XRE-family HTH domain
MEHRFEPHELVQDGEIFGPALLRVREALDVSRRGLSEHALVASSTIATYETKARAPSVEAIVGIAVACGVEPWSAAQHGHLLLSNLAMRSGKTGVPELFIPLLIGARKPQVLGLRSAPAGGVLTAGLAIAMTGGAISQALRQRRGQANLFEVSDKKLIARAESATPLPAAVEKGLHSLVEPRDRAALERDLIEASRKLSDDDLMALVAALHSEDLEEVTEP